MTQNCLSGFRAISVVLIASVLFLSANAFAVDDVQTAVFFSGSSAARSSSSEKRLLELVNAERAKINAGTLKWDSRLGNLARNYSSKMASENFFGHKDRSGKSLIDRIKDFDITNWTGIGENLYSCQGYDDPTEPAVLGWLKSSGHRANLLNSSWKSTGIGIAKSSDGKIYVTQVFMK